MVAPSYDEAISKLRDEYGLDLSDVFTLEQLKEKFEGLDAPKREDARNTLIKNVGSFFGNPDSKELQKQVKKNFETAIADAKTAKELEDIPDLPEGVLFKGKTELEQAIKNKGEEIIKDILEKSKTPSEDVTKIVKRTGESREEVLAKVREEVFSSNERLKGLGASINRQQILDANLNQLKSVEKFAGKLGISEDDGRDVLVREQFTLFNDGKGFKQ